MKHSLLDLIFPRRDLWTDAPVETPPERGLYLSPRSQRYLRVIQAPFCGCCGYPLHGQTDGSEACQQCRHLEPQFQSNRSVLLMNRLGRRLVHEFKYHGGQHLLTDIRRIVAGCDDLRDRIAGHQLVPIPLHPRKERERGFNQSLLLARVFEAELGDSGTRVVACLKRVRDTESQTLKDRKSRLENMRGAFVMNPGVDWDPSIPVTVVDDVFTTGSSINEAARALRQAGAGQIDALTLGHG
jgi:ComF family protein